MISIGFSSVRVQAPTRVNMLTFGSNSKLEAAILRNWAEAIRVNLIQKDEPVAVAAFLSRTGGDLSKMFDVRQALERLVQQGYFEASVGEGSGIANVKYCMTTKGIEKGKSLMAVRQHERAARNPDITD